MLSWNPSLVTCIFHWKKLNLSCFSSTLVSQMSIFINEMWSRFFWYALAGLIALFLRKGIRSLASCCLGMKKCWFIFRCLLFSMCSKLQRITCWVLSLPSCDTKKTWLVLVSHPIIPSLERPRLEDCHEFGGHPGLKSKILSLKLGVGCWEGVKLDRVEAFLSCEELDSNYLRPYRQCMVFLVCLYF